MLQISYEPLWETLAQRNMKKKELTTVISSAALQKLKNDDPVSLNTIMKICETLNIPIEKVVGFQHV